jgi:chaperonin cofactor prefoldin
MLVWGYDMKVAKRRLRNKLRKLIGRRRAIARRLKEIDNALAELGQLGNKV